MLISFFIPCNFNNVDLIFFVNQALSCQQQNVAERVVWCATFKYVLFGILDRKIIVSLYDYILFFNVEMNCYICFKSFLLSSAVEISCFLCTV